MSEKDVTITLEPLTVSIEEASRLTGEGKTLIYHLIQDGEIEAVKSRRKTLIVYASLKKRIANLPKVEVKRKRRRVVAPPLVPD